MKILINDKICGVSNLINYIEKSLNSPYQDDNWDGFRDCLLDLSWVSDTAIEIVHESLPILSERDFSSYIDILYEAERVWWQWRELDFSVVFPDMYKQKVCDTIHSNNMLLFNRMKNERLRQMQFGYGTDMKLRKLNFLFNGFCFSIDKNLSLDYYSLTDSQMSDSLEKNMNIKDNDDSENLYFKTVKDVSSWIFCDCKELIDKDGQSCYRIRFKDTFINKIECRLYGGQALRVHGIERYES